MTMARGAKKMRRRDEIAAKPGRFDEAEGLIVDVW